MQGRRLERIEGGWRDLPHEPCRFRNTLLLRIAAGELADQGANGLLSGIRRPAPGLAGDESKLGDRWLPMPVLVQGTLMRT